MSYTEGYISLWRKILEWEWWFDVKTTYFFIYCLSKANWKQKKWKGITIHPGQFVTSLYTMEKECGLSISEIRTAIKHLTCSTEISILTKRNCSVITINNWDMYQRFDTQNDKMFALTEEDINILEESSVLESDVKEIISTWNELSGLGIKPIKYISSGSRRMGNLKAIIEQYGMDDIKGAIEYIRITKYLHGENQSGWVITFDWFVKPENFLKVHEKQFYDKKPKTDNLDF